VPEASTRLPIASITKARLSAAIWASMACITDFVSTAEATSRLVPTATRVPLKASVMPDRLLTQLRRQRGGLPVDGSAYSRIQPSATFIPSQMDSRPRRYRRADR
jgi:hypothetical protein